MEALLVAGNAMPSFDAHMRFFHFLCEPIIAEWSSPSITSAFGSPTVHHQFNLILIFML
jgi:hypothetical protein